MTSSDLPAGSPARAARGSSTGRAPRRRAGALAVLACAAAGSLGLTACMAPAPLQGLRVEPNLRLNHSGPGPAQGYVALARRYEGEGRWTEALQARHKAAQAAPADANIHDALGQARAADGDHPGAVAALRHAVTLAPEQPALHNNLGFALMRAGQVQQAREALLQALTLQPDYARALANLRRLDAAAAPNPVQVSTVPQPASAPSQAPTPPGDPMPQPEPPTRAATFHRVEIANGNGVEGMAACVADLLRRRGAAEAVRLRNALPYDTANTVVRYRPGHAQAAQVLASQLPGNALTLAGVDRADSLDLRIVLGHDLRATGLCVRRP